MPRIISSGDFPLSGMVLNRKGFFLELGEPDPALAAKYAEANAARTKVAAKESKKPSTASATSTEPVQTKQAKTKQVQAAPAPTSSEVKSSLTTAEAIAAELAAAEAAKPTVELVNFAPEALKPGNAVRPGKRRPGSNLSGFRSMASELFKSK